MDHTFHSDTLHEVLSRLETDQEQGLSLQEGRSGWPSTGRTGWRRPNRRGCSGGCWGS